VKRRLASGLIYAGKRKTVCLSKPAENHAKLALFFQRQTPKTEPIQTPMKIFTTPALLLILMAGCEKSPKPLPQVAKNEDSVLTLSYQQTLKPLVFEYTSTGCPGCGSWGKPTFNSIINEFKEGIVPVAVHIKYGDPMITAISEAVAANRYGQNYTPQIWVNDTNGVQLSGGSINATGSVNNIRRLIRNQTSSAFAYVDGRALVLAGIGTKVKLGIKLMEGMPKSDLYLSCYAMENGLVHNQSSSPSNPTTHNHVIRSGVDGTWGKPALVADSTFEMEHTFAGVTAGGNKYFTAILWRKAGSRYIPIGGYSFN
jgi:hypothetical protein